MYFKAIVGDNLQYLFAVSPLCLYSSAVSNDVVCACMKHALLGCICAYQKQLVSQSFIEGSSWLRVFLKICLFCLLDLLFLVSEYCASRKKSL